MKELTGYNKGVNRNRSQIISSINGRIETGRKNADTVQKQLDAVEEKLRDAIEASKVKVEDESSLPIMDIHEELDDDGKVICRWSSES
jgi:unconventional prefoldin RPB5 interactor 1